MQFTQKIVLFVCLCVSSWGYAQDYKDFPMWNHHLPMNQRIDDVISRLTLEEKIAQMLNATPAIPRLGILGYDWWNEVLHGVARTPFHTTVFPQAIAMAATWDTTSLFKMADYSALEGRAIYNKAIQQGRTHERYLGLTYWTPNINIFRDPRWGRGQETYGEDPFLTAMLGQAFVHGLQGDDPKYLKAAACAKHYAVHSGPEPSRHRDNFDVSNYDLWDTYLPAFETLIVDAKVEGVMCAYNAFRKQPCCANDLLMVDILRKQWNFTGYLTSDCWAINDFYGDHKTHPDAMSASVDAVLHGTDVECGHIAYKSLVEAVQTNRIKEAQLDVSLKRLFATRFKLGMFDPSSVVKYAQTPESVLESDAHKAHALKMAQQSIVLLKNENNTLPLSKNIKKIVVLGPNADNAIAILGNYNGTPSKLSTVLKGIQDKVGKDVEVVYEKAVDFTNDTLFTPSNISQFQWEGKKGFQAAYFNNKDLEGKPLWVQMEDKIDNFWQEGEKVVEGIQANNFSVRYSTVFTADKDDIITFEVDADDGYRLLIDDKEVLNNWKRNRWGAKIYALPTQKNKAYKLVLEYWQGEREAKVKLRAGELKPIDFAALTNKIKDADAIIYVGGISPQLEGEEMEVNYTGFNGGDRTSILLPKAQTDLLKKLKGLNKPLVFVMMTGSAIAIPWEDENVPAILNAWYGGQSAGTAVADVLFGDYNPAGRLPITFYKSDSDLPGFKNYDMVGRTYRYFKGEALYPFGHGLSYSTFQYENIKVPSKIKKGKKINVIIQVKNTGKMDGEEVVQLYVSYPDVTAQAPIRALKGFQRLALKAGESKTLSFSLNPKDLSLVDETGKGYQPEGKVMISIGGGQPDVKRATTSNVLTKVSKIIK
jgi:beta-glucosidase